MAGNAAFFIDELEHAGDVEADDGAVNILFLRVGPDADDLGCFRVIEIEGEFIGREEVVEMGGSQRREGDACAVDLAL